MELHQKVIVANLYFVEVCTRLIGRGLLRSHPPPTSPAQPWPLPPCPTISIVGSSCTATSVTQTPAYIQGFEHVLSTRVPAPGFRLVHKLLPFRAEPPRHGHNAEQDRTGDERVRPPVRRLRVPATGRRPDVLGVPFSIASVRARGVSICGKESSLVHLRDFASSAALVHCQPKPCIFGYLLSLTILNYCSMDV